MPEDDIAARLERLERSRDSAVTTAWIGVIGALLSGGVAAYSTMIAKRAEAEFRRQEHQMTTLSSQALSLFERTMTAGEPERYRATLAVMVLGRVFQQPLHDGLCQVVKVYFDAPPDDCVEAARATLRPSSRASADGDARIVAIVQQATPPAAAGTVAIAPVGPELAGRIADLGSPDRQARLAAARELARTLNGTDVDAALRLFAALTRITDPPVFAAQGLNGRYNLFVVLSETGPFRDRVRRAGAAQRQAYDAVTRDLLQNISDILKEAERDASLIGSQTRRQIDQTRERTPL